MFNAEISAAIQEGLSDALIALGRPFTAETVFSHPSKLELIDNAHAAALRNMFNRFLSQLHHCLATGQKFDPERAFPTHHDRVAA